MADGRKVNPHTTGARGRFAEYEDLTRRVEEEFSKAGGRLQTPPQDGCRDVAGALMAVRDRKAAAERRKDTRKARDSARKYARGFLKHLEPLRQKLEGLIAQIDAQIDALGPEWSMILERYRADEKLLVTAACSVRDLLPALNRPPIATSPDRDPIRHIAEKAREAWASANDGHAPTANNPDDPLVKFVKGALCLIAVHQSEETVSMVLRNKRRTRDGQKKSPKMSA